MPASFDFESIQGAQDLFNWFGYWPDFHDAEIIRLRLNRTGSSSLTVHTWKTTDRVDTEGHFELEKHVVVEFIFDDVSDLTLDGFSNQNVISTLSLKRTDSGFLLTMGPCYGLSGTIEAERVTIGVMPGKPSNVTGSQ